MRLTNPRARVVQRISLTPLIDIVFILLLFFILESNFLRFGELVFNRPKPEQSGQSRVPAVEIQLFADGRIWLEGRALEPDSLDAFLAEKQYGSETPVVVRAQDELPVQTLVQVVDILHAHALAGLQIVRLQE